jgi:hypothetical protein
MKPMITLPLACLALAACNQNDVSLTNASPEQVAKAQAAAGTTAQMRPGKWESRIEILSMDMPEMKGMPAEFGEKMKAELMKARTVSSCMTEEDVKRPRFGDQTNNKCTYDKYQTSGNSITATMSCAGDRGGKVTMNMAGTFGADVFSVEQTMDMTGPTGAMKTKARVSGKRVGDCAPGEK